MNTNPLISIVLPTYNRAQYLEQSIESCQQQSYTNWELIIVDDASTDATPAVIEQYVQHESRIRSVQHASNARLPGALNTGFRLARGDFLTWTSDDDLFKPQALQRMMTMLQEQPAPDFVYADYDVIDATGNFVEVQRVPAPDSLIIGNRRIACFLFRRAIYERIGGYAEDLFLAEDYDYILRVLANNFRMEPVHENLFAYRRHSASLTDRYREQALAAAERALIKNGVGSDVSLQVDRSAVYLQLASLAHWQGHERRAVSYLLQGVRCSPTKAAQKVWQFLGKKTHLLAVKEHEKI